MAKDIGRTGSGRRPALLWETSAPSGGGEIFFNRVNSCLLVSDPRSLASFAFDGSLLWQSDVEGPVYGSPVVLPDGNVARIEGSRIVTRSGGTGETVASFQKAGSSWLAALDDGSLVFCSLNESFTARRILCATTSGDTLWSFSISEATNPYPVGEFVLVNSGGLVQGLGSDGEHLWSFDHRGFSPPAIDRSADGPLVLGPIRGTPVPVEATTLLLNLHWYNGHGFFLVNLATKEIELITTVIPIHPPLAISVHLRQEIRIAALGPEIEVRQMERNWQVVSLGLDGGVIWSHQVHAAPLHFTPGADGTVVISATPDKDRWDRYSKWQNLSADTFVRMLEPDGTERWTWYAPGPLTRLPVVDTDGSVYVASEGMLFALTPAADIFK